MNDRLEIWSKRVAGSIRGLDHLQVAMIALQCMHAEDNGGIASTWHQSSIYFGHKCNCLNPKCDRKQVAK